MFFVLDNDKDGTRDEDCAMPIPGKTSDTYILPLLSTKHIKYLQCEGKKYVLTFFVSFVFFVFCFLN